MGHCNYKDFHKDVVDAIEVSFQNLQDMMKTRLWYECVNRDAEPVKYSRDGDEDWWKESLAARIKPECDKKYSELFASFDKFEKFSQADIENALNANNIIARMEIFQANLLSDPLLSKMVSQMDIFKFMQDANGKYACTQKFKFHEGIEIVAFVLMKSMLQLFEKNGVLDGTTQTASFNTIAQTDGEGEKHHLYRGMANLINEKLGPASKRFSEIEQFVKQVPVTSPEAPAEGNTEPRKIPSESFMDIVKTIIGRIGAMRTMLKLGQKIESNNLQKAQAMGHATMGIFSIMGFSPLGPVLPAVGAAMTTTINGAARLAWFENPELIEKRLRVLDIVEDILMASWSPFGNSPGKKGLKELENNIYFSVDRFQHHLHAAMVILMRFSICGADFTKLREQATEQINKLLLPGDVVLQPHSYIFSTYPDVEIEYWPYEGKKKYARFSDEAKSALALYAHIENLFKAKKATILNSDVMQTLEYFEKVGVVMNGMKRADASVKRGKVIKDLAKAAQTLSENAGGYKND